MCSGRRRRCCTVDCWILVMTGVALFVAVVFIAIPFVTKGGPLHAQCSIDWTFNLNCTSVNVRIASTIKQLGGPHGCDKGGEKCLYVLKSNDGHVITATHETPKQHYVDDLTFNFNPSGNTCKVKGHSTSETWYAVLDYGTNYCNLHNLITVSRLDQVPGYSETTSDSVCTQYSSANCTKY